MEQKMVSNKMWRGHALGITFRAVVLLLISLSPVLAMLAILGTETGVVVGFGPQYDLHISGNIVAYTKCLFMG